MSDAMNPTISRYEETRDDQGDISQVMLTVDAGDRPVTLTVENVDGALTVVAINDQTTTRFEIETVPVVRVGVDELRRRGIDPSLGGLVFADDAGDRALDESTIEAALEAADRAALLDELDARGLNPATRDDADEAPSDDETQDDEDRVEEADDVDEDRTLEEEAPLDHTDQDDLQRAYDRTESISAAADLFEIGYSAVFRRMKDAGIHTPDQRQVDSVQQAATEDSGDDETPDSSDEDEPEADETDEGAEQDADDVSTDEDADRDGEDASYPRECSCGEVCDSNPEYVVHRVEEHGADYVDHPDPGEFEAIVERADSLPDILDETGWQSEKALRMLSVYGLADVVGDGDVTLSDLSEFEFEGLDDDDDTEDEADPDEPDEPSPTVVADGQGEPAFVEAGVDPNDLVDALDGATSATDVARGLNIPDTGTVQAILQDLDLFDELSGTGALDRQTAEDALQGVVADV